MIIKLYIIPATSWYFSVSSFTYFSFFCYLSPASSSFSSALNFHFYFVVLYCILVTVFSILSSVLHLNSPLPASSLTLTHAPLLSHALSPSIPTLHRPLFPSLSPNYTHSCLLRLHFPSFLLFPPRRCSSPKSSNDYRFSNLVSCGRALAITVSYKKKNLIHCIYRNTNK